MIHDQNQPFRHSHMRCELDAGGGPQPLQLVRRARHAAYVACAIDDASEVISVNDPQRMCECLLDLGTR